MWGAARNAYEQLPHCVDSGVNEDIWFLLRDSDKIAATV